MKTKLKRHPGILKIKLLAFLTLILLSFSSFAQWTTSGTNIYNSNTGNVGIGTTAPASKFQVIGESRFGASGNYVKVNSSGALSFVGTGYYNVANNKYVFKQSSSGNRGLYVNQTSKRFEFRDSSSNDLFHVDYYKGDGYFKGNLGIGTASVPGESSVALGGNSTDDGGQIQLNSATSYTTAWFMDNYQGYFRIMSGTNSGSNKCIFTVLGHDPTSVTDGGVIINYAPYSAGWPFAAYVSISNNWGGYGFNNGWWTSSDRRLKTNIKPLENALDKIVKLQGVSYNWIGNPNSDNQIGFIAQDVENFFPEAIRKNDEGNYSMAPQNLVGPIVEAIKEQQKEIEEKDEAIKYLQAAVDNLQNENILLTSRLQNSKNALSQCCMNYNPGAGSSGSQVNSDIATMEQSSPNPFTEKNIIRCYLPKSASTATIKIYSMDGEEIKSLPVDAKGVNQLEIAAGTLSHGTYNYLLIVDGKTIDTKKMIITL